MVAEERTGGCLVLLSVLLLLVISTTAGCIDRTSPVNPFSGGDDPAEDGTSIAADASLERKEDERLLAEAYYHPVPYSLDREDVREIPRTNNVVANGTDSILIHAEFGSQRDLKVGYQLDDEPITWLDPDPQETVSVDVNSDETEADGVAWSFYVDEGDPSPIRNQAENPWKVTVHANGSYPVLDEPARAEDWDEYRNLTLEGLEVRAPSIPDTPDDAGRQRPVVAVIDSGINALHEDFRDETLDAPGSLDVPAVNASSGEPARYVDVGSQEVDHVWVEEALEGQTLYRFSSSPHYFYSMRDNVTDLDESGHGTDVADSVLEEFPQAAIVNVQAPLGSSVEGIEWASQQDWIDIISVSRECPNDCVSSFPFYAAGLSSSPLPNATQTAWKAGKLVVFASGNSPTATGTDPTDGPPWVISVGATDTERKGTAWGTSKAADVVSDVRVDAPYHDRTEGTHEVAGTSYAAPRVAGTLAKAIDQLREEVGHEASNASALVEGETTFTNTDLREALNASAEYWDTTDYDATAREPDLIDVAGGMGVPVNPAAPWLQMGWGYVNASIADEMVEGLLNGELAEKPAEAQTYMEAHQEMRKQAWR